MLSREDFIFTIGYDGPAAIVDGYSKKHFSSLPTKELAEKGMFRAACASAIWSKDPKELETAVEIYNKITGSSIPEASFQRLFGVFPTNVIRSIVL